MSPSLPNMIAPNADARPKTIGKISSLLSGKLILEKCVITTKYFFVFINNKKKQKKQK